MIVMDKGRSNGNALVFADEETYLETGVAKTANLGLSSNTNIQSKTKSQVSHV